jgi:hypothetical protein
MKNSGMPVVYVSKNISNNHQYESESDKVKTVHRDIREFL